MSRRTLAALVVLLACGLARGGDLDLALPVEERTLENGLEVLVLPDDDVPSAVVYVNWRVGSRNERPGITGVAHFFEHMMFTGGARYGDRFDPLMEAAGGSNNAYTTRDVTVYQDWFPAVRLPLILSMEADRMAGMVFRPDVVESERGVVASERRLYMEEPGERLSEQLWATAYTAHPYQWDVLGWMVDIQNWSQADLEAFFETHYSPDNAVLVVVGDVEPKATFELVEELMGPLPRGPERRPIHTQEPEQEGERRVMVESVTAELGRVMLAWHVPATTDPRFPALDVLEALLLGGESSRLHLRLVEQERLCLSVGGGWSGLQFDPSLFVVDATLRSGVDPADVERVVVEELRRLETDGPGARELRKVKNQRTAALVRRLRTIDGKAELLSETHLFFGGWRNLGRRIEDLEAVTPEAVRELLAAHFRPRNRTVGTLRLVDAEGNDR